MPVTIITEHKPLVHVFMPSYKLASASLRVQRLVLKVQDLTLTVQYRPGKLNHIADALSRLPAEDADPSFLLVHAVTVADGVSAHRQLIARETARDSTLCSVRDALRSGKWPSATELAPYQALSPELSVWPFPNSSDFLILRGERVVIPASVAQHVLNLAHEGHLGRDRTLAQLKETQSAFFSLLDLYSRYPAVVRLPAEKTRDIIKALEQIFTLFGMPRHVISDNGAQFCSDELRNQLESWGISHERTVPYTPRQNPVERLNRTLKQHMRKSGMPRADNALRVALKAVRSVINTTTGKPPGDLLLRGGYRTPLRQLKLVDNMATAEDDDEIDEEVRERDAQHKAASKVNFDAAHQAKSRTLVPGQAVFVKQPSGSTEKATIVTATPHDAVITTEEGVTFRRHLDRLQVDPTEVVATATPLDSAVPSAPGSPTATTPSTVPPAAGRPQRTTRKPSRYQ
ncbi:uncharacterized protein LOC135820276 [Sycon ciliatum]|uniref:uncharacterized protein LOC135820276 n=1 Tax=Sycon ciliatum TaxID=27933 RepID=UPI0031F6F844